MTRFSIVVLVAICATGCSTSFRHTLVFDYMDFGPQVAAEEVIGVSWRQWQSHGDHDMDTGVEPVRVVVYRDVPLSQVKKIYPVIKEEGQDYRYLSYSKAMAYLNKTIQEDVMPEVTERHKRTRLRIERGLRKPTNNGTDDTGD